MTEADRERIQDMLKAEATKVCFETAPAATESDAPPTPSTSRAGGTSGAFSLALDAMSDDEADDALGMICSQPEAQVRVRTAVERELAL